MIHPDALAAWHSIKIHCVAFPYSLDYCGRKNANDGWPVSRNNLDVSGVIYQSATYRDVMTDVLYYLVRQPDPVKQVGTWLAAACFTVRGPQVLRYMDGLLINGADHPWSERVKDGPLEGEFLYQLLKNEDDVVTPEELVKAAMQTAREFFAKNVLLVFKVPDNPAPNTVWHSVHVSSCGLPTRVVIDSEVNNV